MLMMTAVIRLIATPLLVLLLVVPVAVSNLFSLGSCAVVRDYCFLVFGSRILVIVSARSAEFVDRISKYNEVRRPAACGHSTLLVCYLLVCYLSVTFLLLCYLLLGVASRREAF